MGQRRGVLFLADPLGPAASIQRQIPNTDTITLIFDENGRYLSKAQSALWQLRRRCDWICAAAEGQAASIALALAAQLPVDRVALGGGGLFIPGKRLPRELTRLRHYARWNISLVISEILLVDAEEREIRGIMRGMGQGRICALDAAEGEKPWCGRQKELVEDWRLLCEKNLLIQ